MKAYDLDYLKLTCHNCIDCDDCPATAQSLCEEFGKAMGADVEPWRLYLVTGDVPND